MQFYVNKEFWFTLKTNKETATLSLNISLTKSKNAGRYGMKEERNRNIGDNHMFHIVIIAPSALYQFSGTRFTSIYYIQWTFEFM